jgi:hypothetical protein
MLKPNLNMFSRDSVVRFLNPAAGLIRAKDNNPITSLAIPLSINLSELDPDEAQSVEATHFPGIRLISKGKSELQNAGHTTGQHGH